MCEPVKTESNTLCPHPMLSTLRILGSYMSPETKRSQLAAGLFPIVLFSSGITFLLTSDNLTLLMPFHTLTQISSEWPCTWHHNPCSGSVSVSLNLLTLVLIVHVWLADENKTVNVLQLSQLPICVHLSLLFSLCLLSTGSSAVQEPLSFSRLPVPHPGIFDLDHYPPGDCSMFSSLLSPKFVHVHCDICSPCRATPEAAQRSPGSIFLISVLQSTYSVCIFVTKMCTYCAFLWISWFVACPL